MYSQTSSSDQLEIGKTLTCSPRRTRPLYRLHSSARWRRGSHWPKSSRKEKLRPLATARMTWMASASSTARWDGTATALTGKPRPRGRRRRSRRPSGPGREVQAALDAVRPGPAALAAGARNRAVGASDRVEALVVEG